MKIGSRNGGASIVGLAVAAAFFSAGTAAAQNSGDYPQRRVEYIIPFGPGGESDITARLQQPFFKKLTGQRLVVQYKPGGGGAVAWSQLNANKGDGYTIMGTNLPHIIVKPMMGNVGFKTKDIVNVYMFEYTPDAIVVPKNSPFKTLDDLIAYAKQHPGAVTMSGTGKGTANHLANVRFDQLAGVKTTYIPFKGTSAAYSAMRGRQVKAEWGYSTVAAKHPDEVRLLALATEHRIDLFPKVPTFREKGFDMLGGTYRGIGVPRSTPEPIREKLSNLMRRINENPAFKKQMSERGFVQLDVSYDKMNAFIDKKRNYYKKLLEQADLQQ